MNRKTVKNLNSFTTKFVRNKLTPTPTVKEKKDK